MARRRMEPIMESRDEGSPEIQEVPDEEPMLDLVNSSSSSSTFGQTGRRARPGPDINILGGRYQLDSGILGSGSTSVVKTARNIVTGERVAIKIIDKEPILSETDTTARNRKQECVKREISIMKMLRHPNIVRIIEVMNSETWIYIVMELVTGGGKISRQFAPKSDTRSILVGMKEGPARKYFQQLISAVDYMHSKGVTHRDLKVPNLLLDAKRMLKVGDFGMSAISTRESGGKLNTACGTLLYLAPEVLMGLEYVGAKADIWSCGIILFYLVAAKFPFKGENRDSTIQKILSAEPEYPPFFSSSLIRLLKRIIQIDPENRITMNEIFDDEWFQESYQPPRFPQESHRLVAHWPGGGSSIRIITDMNAFEIMNTSFIGGNIIGQLFNEVHDQKETRFLSESPPREIIDAIERVASFGGFMMDKRSNFEMSFEGGANAIRRGRLSIEVEIMEVVPYLPIHIVAFRNTEGDVVEFEKFCTHITIALRDVIRRPGHIHQRGDAGTSRRARTSGPPPWIQHIVGNLCPHVTTSTNTSTRTSTSTSTTT